MAVPVAAGLTGKSDVISTAWEPVQHRRCACGVKNRAAQAVGKALASCIMDLGIDVGDA